MHSKGFIAMPRNTMTSSTVGQPGTLAPANYSVAGADMTANPIGNGTVNGVAGGTNLHMNQGLFNANIIRNARGKLMYANPAWIKQGSIPRGNKPVETMIKVNEIGVNEANPSVYQLMEGVTPNTNFSTNVDTITITAAQYGVVMYMTDVFDNVGYIQLKTEVTEKLGWALGRIIDAIVKLYYLAEVPNKTSLFQGAEQNAPLSWLALLRQRAALLRNEVSPPTSEGEFFPLIIHTDQEADLNRDADIRAAVQNSNIGWDPARSPLVHPSRIGNAAGFTFYQTTRCQTYDDVTPGGVADGYINLAVGRDLIASTSLAAPDVGTGPNLGTVFGQGGGMYENNATSPVTMIEKQLGSSGALDPLNQFMSIGAKWTFGLKITQPTAGAQFRRTSNYIV